jgi:hypothetical protein
MVDQVDLTPRSLQWRGFIVVDLSVMNVIILDFLREKFKKGIDICRKNPIIET